VAEPIEQIMQVNEQVAFDVKIAGEGEPVVYLHGAGGLSWDPFLEELSDHYKVYAPHLPGTAHSSGLEHIRDLWDLILCYYDLFDCLGLESVTVIGHSLGGMIAAELAANDQSRVDRLIAISPVGLFHEEEPIADMFAMLPDEMIQLMVADPSSSLAQKMREVPKLPEERIEATIQRMQNMQAAAKFLWPIPDKGLKYRIHRIKAPTLLIWGDQDRFIPLSYAAAFHERIAGSKLDLIEGAGHLVPMEQPAEVIAAIRRFTSTLRASSR